MKEISEARSISQSSNVLKVFKGIIISCIITFVLLFIYAIVLTYTSLGESTIGPVIVAITGVSILAGSSMPSGTFQVFVYILLIYLLSSILGSGFSLNMYSIIMIGIGIVAGIIGGIVGVNFK